MVAMGPDLKTKLLALRDHSSYLMELTIRMSSLLSTAEQALTEEQQSDPHADIQDIEQITEVLRLFSKEADVFCERLKSFLAIQEQSHSAHRTKESE